MDLDITHRVILVSQAALEVSFAAPEKRQLPETVSSKAKLLPKKIDPKENPVPDEIGIANGLFNLMTQSFSNGSESSAHCRFFGQPPW
jgi:hypothetical protein